MTRVPPRPCPECGEPAPRMMDECPHCGATIADGGDDRLGTEEYRVDDDSETTGGLPAKRDGSSDPWSWTHTIERIHNCGVPLGISNADIPVEEDADDIGDLETVAEHVDEPIGYVEQSCGTYDRANPRANDLNYPVGGFCGVSGRNDEEWTFFDGPNEALAGTVWISCDDETFIEDITGFN